MENPAFDRVIHGSVGIVVVKLMSISWWLSYAVNHELDPGRRHYASRDTGPCGLMVVKNFSTNKL